MISLSSEMTDGKGTRARGWLFYDAECEFCTRVVRWLVGPMRRRGLNIAPLQDPRVGALLGMPREELLRAIRFVYGDGTQYEGADALVAVAREIWWMLPMAWLAKFPRVLAMMRVGYAWVARRRKCSSQHSAVGVQCAR